MSSDLARLLANLIRYGTIKKVTTKPARVQVQVGGLLTAPLPWFALRAASKNVRHWSPPAVGEQVIVFSPNGDPASGVALSGIYSDANPPPEGATADNVIMAFGDGAVFLYDLASHVLRGTLPAGGRVEVTAPGGFLFKGHSRFEGDMEVTGDTDVGGTSHTAGKITSDTDVVAGTISLVSHKTKGVTPGSGLSGDPQ